MVKNMTAGFEISPLVRVRKHTGTDFSCFLVSGEWKKEAEPINPGNSQI
jgi:hypothetical protein